MPLSHDIQQVLTHLCALDQEEKELTEQCKREEKDVEEKRKEVKVVEDEYR